MSSGYVTISFLSIRPVWVPLKTSNGVITRPLADTVMAHVTFYGLLMSFECELRTVPPTQVSTHSLGPNLQSQAGIAGFHLFPFCVQDCPF